MTDKRYAGFVKTREYCRRNGFTEISKQGFKNGYNRTIYRPGENFDHYMVKAAVMYILAKRGRPVTSELEMRKNGKGKVFDIFDADQLNQVGIEDTSPEKDADVVVKIAQLPMTARKGLEELRISIEGLVP